MGPVIPNIKFSCKISNYKNLNKLLSLIIDCKLDIFLYKSFGFKYLFMKIVMNALTCQYKTIHEVDFVCLKPL